MLKLVKKGFRKKLGKNKILTLLKILIYPHIMVFLVDSLEFMNAILIIFKMNLKQKDIHIDIFIIN